LSHEDPFAQFGALLDFEPVPRRTARADGWDAEVQRAFIAALSLTGSVRAAARAVGKAAFGAEQLLRCPDSDGFRAACDQAMSIAGDERSRRLAEGLRAVAAEQAGWRPPPPPWSGARTRAPAAAAAPAEPVRTAQEEEAARLMLLNELIRKYLIKIGEERKARLAGHIAAADYYLRQMTWFEAVIDLASGDGWLALERFREEHDCHFIDVAETPMSRILGEARRLKWAQLDEPPRPDHPPRDRLVDHGRFSTEPLEFTRGGEALSHEDQRRAFEERHARDAEAQLQWEAEARRDYEARSTASKPDGE
jgi:hypothetical protein